MTALPLDGAAPGRRLDVGRWLRQGAAAWLHADRALVGVGHHERLDVPAGPQRFTATWRQLQAHWDAGRGGARIAFVSFTFDERRDGSRLLVPDGVLGRTGGRTWGRGDLSAPRRTDGADVRVLSAGGRVRYRGSSMPEMRWLDVVAQAAADVTAGHLEKVVLARDMTVTSALLADVPSLVRRLAHRFPDCYTFAVDGLVGATPELLVRRRGRQVTSLVLAGSARRGDDDDEDAALGRRLLASHKDLREHRPAVESVTAVLGPRCDDLHVDAEPSLLRLANIQHLATTVRGTLHTDDTVLDLAGALHPTGAVCGTPRADALAWIRDHEGLDRGRYGGPVGWVDARGDGELGIALRCIEVDGTQGRLFTGAGVVGESLPEAELEETRLKLHAVQALLEQPRPGR